MNQNSQKISVLVPALLAWFESNARDLPWRRTCDPYAIWISEIMLQQTQVKTVIPYWERWMKALPDVQALAAAKPERVLKLWEGLGYYSRARNAQKAAQLIVAQHGGVFPRALDQVLELPGIGRYTAGAICSIAFNQPTPILDGNVARVLSRVFGVEGHAKEKDTNARLWQLAQDLVSCAAEMVDCTGVSDCAMQIAENFKFDAADFKRRTGGANQRNCSQLNQALMELGALVCVPRQANCASCPAQKFCFAYKEKRVEEFPHPAPRVVITRRRFAAFVVERDGRYLARQRGDGVVNARFWEFPNIELPEVALVPVSTKDFILQTLEPFCRVIHSITRYRITLEAFRAELRDPGGIEDGRWLTLTELKKLPFTSAHRKIVEKISKAARREE